MKHSGKTQKTTAERKNNRIVLGTLVTFVLVVILGIAGFMRFYNSYIDGILYQERLHQMQEVTTQLYSGLENVVESQWNLAKICGNDVEDQEYSSADELIASLQKLTSQNLLEEADADIVAVDDKGRYLTQDGWQGTLTDMDYLSGYPDQVSFVSQAMTSDQVYMYFMTKLSHPVIIPGDTGMIHILYVGTAHNMQEMNPYFACKAYDNSNSMYVLDEQGARLFRSGNGAEKLLKGYNAYSTLRNMTYLHGTSFEETKEQLDEKGLAYSNAVLDGEEYYYSLYRMNGTEWTLLFLVPSSYVAKEVVSLVTMTARLILSFSILLLIISTGVITMILWRNQKQAVGAERRNNEALRRVNAELDRKNAALSEAKLAAESAAKDAEAANRAKSDFLANMSHDIRTPMNAIVGITNLMEHEGGLSERLYGYIQKIKLSSHHLLSLINDVLDMSKIEASEVELNVEPIRLAEQVGQVDSIIRSQTNERGQTFRILLHEVAHEHLLGDSTRLRQVFLNLLSNAVKYTPNGGAVTFEISELPQRAPGIADFSFKVTDTGCGMTPEFISHVFEPFTRAENSVTNKVPGTGLGMAITKNIVDLMGGTITVTSRVNEGSCFEAKIPLRIDPNVQCTLKGRKILLVSDDERLIRNIQAVIHENGLVMEVLEPKKALYLAPGSVKADIILLAGYLLDCGLSQLVDTLRKADASAQMVFCVDYAQKDQVQEILQHAGVDGLIARPFFLTGLEMAVDRVRSSNALDAGGQSPLEGMRFLCAEDNALNAEILEAILEMYGATCKIYPDGEEIVKAFEQVKPGEFDAILMDIQMPHMDGYEATRAIRSGKNPMGKTFPIIAMTANAFSDDVQHSLEAGMDAHVAKPIDLTVLEKTIKKLNIRKNRRPDPT